MRGAGTPRVSIGLPVFNGERFLAESIESVLAQSHSDLELVISDNASTDGTETLCRRYAERDPRVIYQRAERNRGAAWNYNRVLALSRGELFKWLGHDDRIAPSFVERCMTALDQADPGVVLCYTRTILIDETGAPRGVDRDDLELAEALPWQRLAHLTRRYNLCNPVLGLIRREALERTRRIGPFVSSDLVLLAELALLGRFLELPEPLLERRIHAASSRAANRSARQVADWFAPSVRRRLFVWPRGRLFLEILRSVARAPLPPQERLAAALAFVATWSARWTRVQLGAARARLFPRRDPSATASRRDLPSSDGGGGGGAT